MQDNNKISLWDRSSQDISVSLPMNGDITTEVAIVGAGFTGLSTALHLAEDGVECHVLDAQKVGYGGSGRNVGLVNPGVWMPPQNVRYRLGNDRGAAFMDMLGNAPDLVFSLIEKHRIECEATRNGSIHAAHSPAGFKDLTARAKEWQRLGAPIELLEKSQADEKIGCTRFYGGLLDRRAGTVNPMGYARGLATAAVKAGAHIHEGVKVTRLVRDGERWILETTAGRVSAKSVILGSNAYTDELWPGLKQVFTKIHFFQAATQPLGDLAKHILPEGQGLWDTGMVMFSLRRDVFGRVIIGSMGKLTGGDRGLSRRWASHKLQQLFPELGKPEWETAWDGKIALTPDHLPRIHRLEEGLYTPIGYNGRGITTGSVMGKCMAKLLTGSPESDLLLPITDVRKVYTAPIASRVYETAFKANQLYKSFI